MHAPLGWPWESRMGSCGHRSPACLKTASMGWPRRHPAAASPGTIGASRSSAGYMGLPSSLWTLTTGLRQQYTVTAGSRAIPAWRAGGRLEGAEDIAVAASPVVDLLLGPFSQTLRR